MTQKEKNPHGSAVCAPKPVCAPICAPKLVWAPKLVGSFVCALVCAPKFVHLIFCGSILNAELNCDVGQIVAVGIRRYHQGAGQIQEKITCRAKVQVNLYGAACLPRGVRSTPRVILEPIPSQAYRVLGRI